jgi:pimeloyl-ACP methyl ester carboxylesterase
MTLFLRSLAVLVTCLVLVVLLAVDASAEPVFRVRVASGGGPAVSDSVTVRRFGPASARTVLVLTPGQSGGAGAFTFVARDLVRRVAGLQVWAVARREQVFEDTSAIEAGDSDQALGYYLRGEPVNGRKFDPPAVSQVRFMAHWGLRLLLDDLRRVVHRAAAGSRRVILGGHSLGATVAEAYAGWDFAGYPGYRDLAGLVVIDGGALSGARRLSLAQARAELADIKTKGPRVDIFNQGVPYLYGVGSEIAGLYAHNQPQAASVMDSVPLVASAFTPPFPTTNQTWLGLASQALYPPQGPATAHGGHPAPSGDPRPWVDGDITPIDRLARWTAQAPIGAFDWYVPRRLVLDVHAAGPLTTTPVTRLLGLHLTHTREIRLPLYAFQTSLGAPGVLGGARGLARGSRISGATLVSDTRMTHFDPLTALTERNTFARTVTPFLRRIANPSPTSNSKRSATARAASNPPDRRAIPPPPGT